MTKKQKETAIFLLNEYIDTLKKPEYQIFHNGQEIDKRIGSTLSIAWLHNIKELLQT